MSSKFCEVCRKKYGLGRKRSKVPCWSCQANCCSHCCSSLRGRELGWVKAQTVCAPCRAALEKHKAKMSSPRQPRNGNSETDVHNKPAKSVSEVFSDMELESWQLPKVPQETPPTAPQVSSLAVGQKKAAVRRLSRVILKTLADSIERQDAVESSGESYSEGEDEEEEEEDVSSSGDLDSLEHQVVVRKVVESQVKELSQIQRQMEQSKVPVLRAVETEIDDAFLESILTPEDDQTAAAEPRETPERPSQDEMASFDLDLDIMMDLEELEREFVDKVPIPGPNVQAQPAATKVQSALDLADDFDDDVVANIAETLSGIASRGAGAELMHDEILGVVKDVKEEHSSNQKAMDMLNSVEARLNESLVATRTPPVRRKVSESMIEGAQFKPKQVLSAKSGRDGCYYNAVVDAVLTPRVCSVRFLLSGEKQDTPVDDMLEFVVGNRVIVKHRKDDLWYAGAIEAISPSGSYTVSFSDGTFQGHCTPANVARDKSWKTTLVHNPAPRQMRPAKAQQSTKAQPSSTTSPLQQLKKGVGEDVAWMLARLEEHKATANRCVVDIPRDRVTLLVVGQVLSHLKLMYGKKEAPVFTLKIPDASKVDTTLFVRLVASIVQTCDFLIGKFNSVQTALAMDTSAITIGQVSQLGLKINSLRSWLDAQHARIKLV